MVGAQGVKTCNPGHRRGEGEVPDIPFIFTRISDRSIMTMHVTSVIYAKYGRTYVIIFPNQTFYYYDLRFHRISHADEGVIH